MKKKWGHQMKLLLVLIMAVTNIEAAVFAINGSKVEFQSSHFMISELVKSYASLEKMNVVFDSDYNDEQITTVGPKSIDKKSLDLYISAMLSQSGFGMRILPETRTLSVFKSRDVRYFLTSSYKNIAEVPDTYEHVQFMYELKHIPSAELARNMRPLISRYGRIIEHTNSIFLSDSGKNIRRIMKLIQELDNPDYLKHVEEVKELNEKNKKTIERKQEFLKILSNNNVIFIILFSIVGAIIGFGIRGYAMKRIEGGW